MKAVLVTTFNGYASEPVCVTTEELLNDVLDECKKMGYRGLSTTPIQFIDSIDKMEKK